MLRIRLLRSLITLIIVGLRPTIMLEFLTIICCNMLAAPAY